MVDAPLAPWSERNDIIRIFKISGKFGWLHLIIAVEKSTGRRYLRLKRYQNWFSIPDAPYFSRVQKMLSDGAKFLEWSIDEDSQIQVEEIKDKAEIEAIVASGKEIPEEIIDLIEKNPELIDKIISFCSSQSDIAFLSKVLNTLGENIALANERLRIAFKDLLEKITKEDEKGLRELSDLMEQWNLFQIASVSSLIKERLETIHTFEQMIHDEKTYEINTDHSIHRVLEKSMWLIDENLLLAYSNSSLRTFISEELMKHHRELKGKRFDFAVVDADNKLMILEIKAPSVELKKKEIDQIELYLRIVKQYKAKKYRSVEGILIGNKISHEADEIMEYRKGISLMTYDDLLERCRKRYLEYLKLFE